MTSSPATALARSVIPESTRRVPPWVDPALFPFASRFLDVAGHRIHYLDEGDGPAILMIHPAPAWCLYFREIILGLRGDFRCIALDLPGFGLSEAAPGFDDSLPAYAEAVDRFVEALGVRDLTLLLHDSGGPIGLGMAVRRPRSVRVLILTSTFAWSLRDYPRVRFMLKLVSSPPFVLLNGCFNLLPRLVTRFAPRRRRLHAAERRAITGAFPTWARRRRILTLLRELATRDDYLSAVEAGIRGGLADRPALIVFGEHDPVRAFGFPERLAGLFPHHSAHFVAGEQHFAHLAAAPEMIRLIRDFWLRWTPHERGV